MPRQPEERNRFTRSKEKISQRPRSRGTCSPSPRRYLLDPSSVAAATATANPSQYLSKILSFRGGRPLARSTDPPAATAWRLMWLPPSRVPGVALDPFVFLGALVEGNGKEAAPALFG